MSSDTYKIVQLLGKAKLHSFPWLHFLLQSLPGISNVIIIPVLQYVRCCLQDRKIDAERCRPGGVFKLNYKCCRSSWETWKLSFSNHFLFSYSTYNLGLHRLLYLKKSHLLRKKTYYFSLRCFQTEIMLFS